MQEFLAMVMAQIAEEAVGFVGGVIFFGSWMLQAWESRRAGKPTVSRRFFAMRIAASGLLTFEGIRSGSWSVAFVMAATTVLMMYNLWLGGKGAPADQEG